MEVSLDEVIFPQEYVRAQMAKVKRDYQLKNTQMAKLAGFDRVTWARIMKTGVPNIRALYRLSVHFNLPMDFWFPPLSADRESPTLPPPRSCICHSAAPLSREILKRVGPLSAVQKLTVLKSVKMLV